MERVNVSMRFFCHVCVEGSLNNRLSVRCLYSCLIYLICVHMYIYIYMHIYIYTHIKSNHYGSIIVSLLCCMFFYKFSTLGSNDNESICTVSDSITWPARKKNAHPRDFHAQLESEISYFSKRLEYNSLLDIRGRAFET